MTRTPWRVRTSRGMHLYYRHPGVHVGNKVRIHTKDGRLKLDVRGDGGYAIGPGSIHETGKHYVAEGDWSVPKAKLPAFWVGLLVQPRTESKRLPSARPVGLVLERARRYLRAIPPPEIGSGSDSATLYAACRLVRGFELSEADAVALLWEWAGNREGWTLEWIERKVSNAREYGVEPVGGLK